MTFRLVTNKWQPFKWSYFCYFQNNGFKTISCVNLSLLLDEKKNTVQAQQWRQKCCSDSAPSKRTICYWFAKFKRGRTDTDDGERSGRSIEVVTPGNIKKIHKLVISDRKLKLRETAETIRISEDSVFTIMHEDLTTRKLFSEGVPHSRSKTTTCWWFRAVFGHVYT